MDPNLLGGLAGGLGSALGGALGGPTSSAASLSNATASNFFAPSIFNIGSGSPSTQGDIGSTAQDPYSAATATASQALPPTSALLGQSGASLLASPLLWIALAGAAALLILNHR